MGCAWGSTENTPQRCKYHRRKQLCCCGTWKKLYMRDKQFPNHFSNNHYVPVAVSIIQTDWEAKATLRNWASYKWWLIYCFLGDSFEYSTWTTAYFCILLTQNLEIHSLNPYTKQRDNILLFLWSTSNKFLHLFLCIKNYLPPNYFHRKYKQHFFPRNF